MLLAAVVLGHGYCPSALGAGGPAARDGNGKIDLDVLKIRAMFFRNSYVIAAASDLDVHLGAIQTMELSGPDVEAEQAYSLYREGKISREKFLAAARQRLAKRQAAVDAALKGNKPKIEDHLKTDPYLQIQLFSDLFGPAFDEMRLPPDKVDKTSNWMKSHSFDLQQEKRQRALDEKLGKTTPPPRDTAWLEQTEHEYLGHVMKELTDPQRHELVRAWPVLFPGATLPPTDDASYADVGKKPAGDSTKENSKPADAPKPAIAEGADNEPKKASPPATDGGKEAGDDAAMAASDKQEWQKLLPLLDVTKNAASGTWEGDAKKGIRNIALADEAQEPSKIVIPIRPDGSYEIAFTVNHLSGEGPVCLLFPIDKQTAQLWLGAGNKGKEGNFDFLQFTGAGGGAKQPMGHHRAHQIRVQVKVDGPNATVVVSMDARKLFDWTGKHANLRPLAEWKLPADATLGFGVAPTSVYEIKDVRLRELSGGAAEKR